MPGCLYVESWLWCGCSSACSCGRAWDGVPGAFSAWQHHRKGLAQHARDNKVFAAGRVNGCICSRTGSNAGQHSSYSSNCAHCCRHPSSGKAYRVAGCHFPQAYCQPRAGANTAHPRAPTCCALCLQAYENAKSIKGKSQAAVLAAIVFLACRHTGNARTFKEICAVVPQASVKVRRRRLLATPASFQTPDCCHSSACLGCWHTALFRYSRLCSLVGCSNM